MPHLCKIRCGTGTLPVVCSKAKLLRILQLILSAARNYSPPRWYLQFRILTIPLRIRFPLFLSPPRQIQILLPKSKLLQLHNLGKLQQPRLPQSRLLRLHNPRKLSQPRLPRSRLPKLHNPRKLPQRLLQSRLLRLLSLRKLQPKLLKYSSQSQSLPAVLKTPLFRIKLPSKVHMAIMVSPLHTLLMVLIANPLSTLHTLPTLTPVLCQGRQLPKPRRLLRSQWPQLLDI